MTNFRKLNNKWKFFIFLGLFLLPLVFVLNKNQENQTTPIKQLQEFSLSSLFIDSTKKAGLEPEFILVGKNSLKSFLPPYIITPQVLGTLIEGNEPLDARKTIIEYIVEEKDSLSSISEKFNISLNTLLWANNLNRNSKIQPGQKLIIPPVSGVIHHVKEGETISEIAKKYKAKTEEIIAFNELSLEGDIYIGDILIIPDGVMPPPSSPKKSTPRKDPQDIPSQKYTHNQIPLPASYFICPIPPPCRITQGLHWYNAVDFSNGQCGDLIFAAAGGKVLKVKLTNSTSRWAFGGAGNHITILHPNGTTTTYGHIATSFVNPGDEVSQGQIIALMGGQPGTPGAGNSTGCHLHFSVGGAKNPFAK